MMNITETIRTELLGLLQSGLASSTFTTVITDDTSLLQEVGLDSVQIIELIVAIEKHFKIPVFDEDISASLFDNFGDMVAFIEKKLNS
ncbi:acyl carrier protein [compost metagenome]